MLKATLFSDFPRHVLKNNHNNNFDINKDFKTLNTTVKTLNNTIIFISMTKKLKFLYFHENSCYGIFVIFVNFSVVLPYASKKY